MRAGVVAVALVFVLLQVSVATAQPPGGVVPVVRTASDTEVALAGTQLMMARTTRRGVRLFSAPATGGTARRLFSIAARGPRRFLGLSDLDASSERVVFSLVELNPATEGIVGSSVWAGPPGGPFAPIARRSGGAWIAVRVQASGPDVAFTEIQSVGDEARHHLFPAGGAGVRIDVPPETEHIELAGSLVAYVDGERQLVLRDRAGGVERLRHTAGGPIRSFDLAADGRALLHVFSTRSLELVDASGSVTRVGSAGAAPDTPVRLAGNHAVLNLPGRFDGDAHVAAIDPATGQARRLSPPSLDLGRDDARVDAEGELVAWTANGCVFSAPVAGPRSSLVPPGPCPRAEILLEADRPKRLQGRTARVRLRCVTAPPPGCRGTVRLLLERPIGKARYVIPAGRRETVRVRLTDRGLAALEREFELPPPGSVASARVRVALAGGINPRSATPHEGITLRPARP
jgi:hypothetical protein